MKKVFTALLFLSFSVFSFSQTDIVVDPNAKYQTFKGFGVSLAWWANIFGGWSDSAINDVCASLTSSNELNLNYFRFDIGGGDSSAHDHMRSDGGKIPGYKTTRTANYDWSVDSNQRKILKKLYALKSSAHYEVISYSPPYWMTKSGCSAGNTDSADNLKDADYTTFAGYLTDVVKHYKDAEGVTFSKLTPMNEPFSNWWVVNGVQEGCAFSLANQKKLINAVYDSLTSKNMLSYCKISAMDANNIDEALSGLNGYDSSVLSKVHDISTHSYGGTQRAQLYSTAAAKGKEIWQTETGPIGISETGMDNYLVMANRIIDDLKNMKAVAWADWQAISTHPNWGLWTYDLTNKTYTKVKAYYVRKQFSKYLKPGYTIVNSSVNTIAALNSANNELVIVLVNTDTTNNVSYKVDLNLFASTGTSASAYRTSPTQDCAQLSSITISNNIFSYTAPARSVTTFVIPVTLAPAAPITSGNFRITAKHSNKDMSVAGLSESDGAVIEQWAPLGQENQVFNVQWTSAGYKLLPSYNAKAVTVNGYSSANGAVINQWSDLEQTNQRFSIIDVGDGYYKIVARHSGKCLAVTGSGMNNGDDVVQWEWLNADNFKWQFTLKPIDSTLANGTYNIKAKHSSKIMSIAGWSEANGGVVEQWDSLCQNNLKFSMQFTSTGYIIKPSYNNKVLSVNNYSVANGAAIVQWDDLTQSYQRYQIVSLGGGYYKIVSRYTNKCLAVTGNGMNNGDDIVQWEWLNNDSFKWAFKTPCASARGAGNATAANIELLPENNQQYLKVYPNPSSDYITIQYSGIDNAQIQIYDMSGKLMMIRKGLNNTETINVSTFGKGVYTLKISGTNKIVVEKIIVQ